VWRDEKLGLVRAELGLWGWVGMEDGGECEWSGRLGRVNGERIEFCSLVCISEGISTIPIILIDRVQSVTFIMLGRAGAGQRKERQRRRKRGFFLWDFLLLLPFSESRPSA